MRTPGPTATKALYAGVLIASAMMTLPAVADLSLRLEGYAFGTRQQVAYNTANLWDETSTGDTFFQLNTKQHIWSDVDGVISGNIQTCLLYTSPSPRDGLLSRMPSSA